MKGSRKEFAAIALLCVGLATVVHAAVVKYNAYLVNESALAYNKAFGIALNQTSIDLLAFQTIASSATVASTTVGFAAIGKNGSVIVGTNTFTTALPVLYTNTGTAIGGLTTGTTYYTALVNGAPPGLQKAFFVATTSTGAQAGSYVTFTSSSSAGTYRFAPLTISGTPSYRWQVSNDGSNWMDFLQTSEGVSVSSRTLSAYVSTGTIDTWDFGNVGYAFIRLNVVAPTTGGLNLVVSANGKNSGS